MRDRLRIVHVYGSGRSGTTLVGTLLGQIDGVFYAGELHPLWGPSWLPDELCSCGQPVSDCPVWSRILKEVTAGRELPAFIAEMLHLRDTTSRARHLLFSSLYRARRGWLSNQQQFVEHTERLFRAIQQVTNCSVIVDTSKSPSYSALMARSSNLDWRVLHLVRDPRGVVWSWRRKKTWLTAKDSYTRQQGTAYTVIAWLVQNILAEVFRRSTQQYLRLRYEDFMEDPLRGLESVARFVGVVPTLNYVKEDATFYLGDHHSVGANPGRVSQREVKLKLDNEWKENMSVADKVLIWLLTLPLAARYRYPLAVANNEPR